MRLTILLLVFLVPCFHVHAQWSAGSTTDPTYRDGNVGIGVPIPAFKLDIMSSDSVAYEQLLRLRTNDAPSGDYFSVINTTGTGGRFIPALVGSHVSSNSQALLFIGNISSSQDTGNSPVFTFDARANSSPVSVRPLFEWRSYTSQKMVLSADGNLGIGTTALPASKLVVNGAIWIPHAGTTDNESPGLIAVKGDDFPYYGEYLNHYGFGFHKFNDGNGLDGTNAYMSGYYGIDLFSGGQSRLRVNLNGNVRIGTGPANVNAALTVVNEDNSEVAIWSNQSSSVAQLTFRNNANSLDGGIIYRSDGRMSFNLDGNNAAGMGANEYLTILPNGNIGIGSTSPTSRLSVNGTVHAEEVKVDLSVPGPDYVFEKGYPLPALEEVKAYIDEHKHLPEVPSAKEMEEEGVNVGEMEMVLLKKVEELTLYAIEQNDMIVQLRQERHGQPGAAGQQVEELNLRVVAQEETILRLQEQHQAEMTAMQAKLQQLTNRLETLSMSACKHTQPPVSDDQ